MLALGLALAALIGLSLGLLGGGGSILTVPVFVYVLGYAAKPAIAMSLPVVGTTSLVGAVRHWREGNVNLRVALLFGVVAMLGSFTGARFAARVRGPLQLLLLGAVMLAAAASMLRRPRALRDAEAVDAVDGSAHVRPLVYAVGLGVGFLTGLVGIGGGFLIVPALVVLAHVPMKQAVGTSLVVIAMNSASGYAGYAGRVHVPWPLVAAFTAVAIVGIVIGTRLVRHIPALTLRRAFGVFLVLLGALVVWQNRGAFGG
ncbi:protein of unknown function DUF81 [Gemmatirosa kalamazoonensis]|uniref:Probable membrane transporter protein n=1 Tax=Gemmatirosa kalamazoonensis TaxID=861299 RepID=W0REX9_9BACT|nr:sulfite exporter TauE/SafE family protein [Gemmatirosa kalamazoonensis]AHG89341.1 protein of unknown function DUF81 [Gemmatirosa kalamazoonensis]